MKIQAASYSFKIISFFLLILAGSTSSQQEEPRCPFKYVYHFGDGVTDTGNSIHIISLEQNPSQYWPYGMTYPGWPTGRWSDGLVDFDYTSMDFGVPVVPYLERENATISDGVIFSVGRSPVLPRSFFSQRGINITSYAVPLESQMTWFRTHLQTVCSTSQECAEWLADSLVLMGDIEANDIGYALTQGKSIGEVRRYVPLITRAQIDASRELLRLGTARLIIPGNAPLGCYPYILTALQTNDTTDYDELGCLKSVNELVVYKNNHLQRAIDNLQSEFPDRFIGYGNMFDGVKLLINNVSVIGNDGINVALKTCCGVGGKYNYDSERFCGSSGVPVCTNPDKYTYWDGLHFTQEMHYKIEQLLVGPALEDLGCTLIQSYGKSSISAASN